MKYKEIEFPEENDYNSTENGLYVIDVLGKEYSIKPINNGIEIKPLFEDDIKINTNNKIITIEHA